MDNNVFVVLAIGIINIAIGALGSFIVVRGTLAKSKANIKVIQDTSDAEIKALTERQRAELLDYFKSGMEKLELQIREVEKDKNILQGRVDVLIETNKKNVELVTTSHQTQGEQKILIDTLQKRLTEMAEQYKKVLDDQRQQIADLTLKVEDLTKQLANVVAELKITTKERDDAVTELEGKKDAK